MESLLPFLQGTCTPYNMPVYPAAQRTIANSLFHPGFVTKSRAVSTDSNGEHATGACAGLREKTPRRHNFVNTRRETRPLYPPPLPHNPRFHAPQNSEFLLLLRRPIRPGIMDGLFCAREDSP